jgi:hypothetical protein
MIIFDIQKTYEVSTCLNLKIKNRMARRPWNRMRLPLSCEYKLLLGDWHRKKVGVLQVGVPMLPEERTLMTLQREIEEEFGMKLGSDGSGKSVSASLLKCLAADCPGPTASTPREVRVCAGVFAEFAQATAINLTLVHAQSCNGEALKWQVMDACGTN